MANEYFVNAADLTSVANAIRIKRKTTNPLSFPTEFVTAIEAIKGGLNFEVVGGTTQPTDPAENTIWVNTNVEITGWAFSDEMPTAADGLVWFGTDGTSGLNFDAVDENVLKVYLSSAKIYTSSAWSPVTAAIYKNGVWRTIIDRAAKIAELNATGYARFSESVASEYCRFGGRGYTRTSILPAIWCVCWTEESSPYGAVSLIAATKEAATIGSQTDYGNADLVEVTTPSRNKAYIRVPTARLNSFEAKVTSNGATFSLSTSKTAKNIYNVTKNTLGANLGAYVDALLF